MTFAAPLWLIALLPLAGVMLYLLWGRRRQAAVPFLDLWLGPVKGPKPARRFAAPPVALALAILAMLLAVLGAARPALWDPTAGAPVTVIVDRGATMSAAGRAGGAARLAQGELLRLGPLTPVDLVAVPGGARRSDVSDFAGLAAQLPPTALDTTAALAATVARRVAETSGPVVVLTDRDVPTPQGRVVRVTPPAVRNVGISHVAARDAPAAQVMVRVVNDSTAGRAGLRVNSGGREVARDVDLPPRGDARDYFVDVPVAGDVVKVELTAPDDFAGDDAAWLVRGGGPPRIEPRGDLPAELRRMIDVYAGSRPPRPEAPRAAVVRDAAALPPSAAGVVLAPAANSAPGADVQVLPHPVTRDTRWTAAGAFTLADAPPPGWTPVVLFGGRVAVAVRDSPARQVWVGLESQDWARTPEYVVFWANVFDWLGSGAVSFTAHLPGRLEGKWRAVEVAGGGGGGASPQSRPADAPSEPGLWPGLYERAEDGALRAVNAGEVRFAAPAGEDWRAALRQALATHARGSLRSLAPGVLLAAGACLALAAAAWKRSPERNLTAFSGGRTVPAGPRSPADGPHTPLIPE